jgi:uncharacterized phage protein gp47/JayE
MLTLAQLLRVPTLEEARQYCINILVNAGFKSAASWREGSLPRTCAIELPAAIMVDVSQSIANIAAGFYGDTAEGDWLTLYSLSHYENERKAAVRARGPARLTAGVTGHTIAVDYLVASDATGRHTFRNKTGGTLAPNSTLVLEWEAEQAGSEANSVGPGMLTTLQTTLAGVTINNPGVSGAWLTRAGADEESDEALRLRNRTKWFTRAMHAPEDAYRNWALEAATEITRAEVDSQNPEGPGSLRIYIATAQGETPSELEDVVLDYINGDGPDGIVRLAIGAEVFVSAAEPREVIVSGTVYQSAPYAHSAEATVEANLAQFQSVHPIGGVKLEPAEPGALLRASLYGQIMRVPGVMNVDLQTPSADVPLAVNEVVTFNVQLEYVTV